MTSIDLTVHHSHAQAVAWQRLLDCLQAPRPESWFATVKRLGVNLDDVACTIATKISVTFATRTVTHTLKFEALPSSIYVTWIDADDEFLEPLEVAFEKEQIKATITEAMK